MADSMDLVQQRTDEMLAKNIARVIHRPKGVASFICEFCGDEIPEARRRAVIDVSTCITCQSLEELKNKHGRG